MQHWKVDARQLLRVRLRKSWTLEIGTFAIALFFFVLFDDLLCVVKKKSSKTGTTRRMSVTRD